MYRLLTSKYSPTDYIYLFAVASIPNLTDTLQMHAGEIINPIEIIIAYKVYNSTELVKLSLDKLGWKKSTTYTVLRKLCERGILKNEDAMVSAIVKKEEVQKYESHTIIEKAFDGSLPQFLTAFLVERKITEKEADELKRIIEEAAK